jgi:hypothetical protein
MEKFQRLAALRCQPFSLVEVSRRTRTFTSARDHEAVNPLRT